MLFAVTMESHLPDTLADDVRADLIARESAYAVGLQRGGEWRHLWRIAGKTANLSILDVADGDRLHEILSGLPLFPYLTIDVTALAAHPNDASRHPA